MLGGGKGTHWKGGSGPHGRRVNIHDVARESGVALSTVSNALSGKKHVSAETRLKVKATADRLGYRASAVARGLRMQRTFTLGVLTEDISNPAFPDFVRGIEDVAVQARCNLLLCNNDGDFDKQLDQMRTLIDRQVDGIVLVSQYCSEEAVRKLLESGPPYVLLQRRSQQFRDDYVGADNAAGIEAAVRHLVELGHRRVGFIRGPAESSTAAERLEAFRAAARKFGLDPDPDLVFPGDYKVETGRRAGRAFLELKRPPTAIMASNDLSALGVIEAAAEKGVAIPEDLSLVGFDDIALASISRISLTTIHLPKRAMGAAAADLLMKQIRSKRRLPPTSDILPTYLVVRKSTGPAKRAAAKPGRRRPAKS